MHFSTFHLGLSLSLGFLLLVPLTVLVKDRAAAEERVAIKAHIGSVPSGAALAPIPRVLPAASKTPCEEEAGCVSFANDLLGMAMPHTDGVVEQVLAGRPFQCRTRMKAQEIGGVFVGCRLNTNHETQAEHEAAIADLLQALRDRHGAEHSWRVARRTDHLEETWDWGSRKNGDRRMTLRVQARWRYNPRGLGSPNVIKMNWQGVGW